MKSSYCFWYGHDGVRTAPEDANKRMGIHNYNPGPSLPFFGGVWGISSTNPRLFTVFGKLGPSRESLANDWVRLSMDSVSGMDTLITLVLPDTGLV